MQALQQGVPFDFVADPEKVYCKELGIEASLASILKREAIAAGIRGVLRGNLPFKMAGTLTISGQSMNCLGSQRGD